MNAIKVLVIEDNAPLRDMIRRRLKRLNFEVEVAENGEYGEQLARTSRPEVILMDMHLPGKNGWEIALELKSSPETQSIPIIAVTAHAMSGDRERTMRAGCNDYISKPIDFNVLEEKILYLINGTEVPLH